MATNTTTYGPFLIKTFPPIDDTLTCSSDLEPKYAYAGNNNLVELRTYSEISADNIDNGLFFITSEFAGTSGAFVGPVDVYESNIYNDNGTEKKYWSNTFDELSKIELVPFENRGFYIFLTEQGLTGGNGGFQAGRIYPGDDWYIQFKFNIDKYVTNFLNGPTGEFINNDLLIMGDYGFNFPTSSKFSPCVSRYTIMDVPSSIDAVLSSNNSQLQANNIKVRRIVNDNFINMNIFKSNCVFEGGSIRCNREQEDLLSVHGYKVDPEPCFHTTYKVRIKVNKNIVKQKCEEHRLSFYNLDENYTVVKFRKQHTLITNSITPVCSKINEMVAKMNRFIAKCQKSKCRKSSKCGCSCNHK